MKKRVVLSIGITLAIVGAIILAVDGVTEFTRVLITPCFTFSLMFIVLGTEKSKKSIPPNQV